MRYGHFDDEQREYVITRPDTPLPWINYLGSDDYFGIISNTAGGYSFYRDARLRRLTRYRYNNAPLDVGGRYLYLRDDETGEYWSPSWQPVQRELQDYSCRHGLGYTIISSRYLGIRAETLYFVPLSETLEVWRTRLTNEQRRAAPAVALQRRGVLPLGRAGRRHQLPAQLLDRAGRDRGRRHLPHDRVPRTTRPLRLVRLLQPPGRVRHAARRVPRARIAAGIARSPWRPAARATRSRTAGSRLAHTTCASTLAPHETREVIFVLGYAENPRDAKFDPVGSQTLNKRLVQPVIERFLRADEVERAFVALRDRWTELLGIVQVETGNQHVDRMVNIWNAYQCMVTFNLSRAASLFESGIGRGMGFRDSNQDLLGFVHMVPERARQRILDIAATQLQRAARTTSTSRSPSAATTPSAPASTTIRPGWCSAWPPT